jgi:hypothetical protein
LTAPTPLPFPNEARRNVELVRALAGIDGLHTMPSMQDSAASAYLPGHWPGSLADGAPRGAAQVSCKTPAYASFSLLNRPSDRSWRQRQHKAFDQSASICPSVRGRDRPHAPRLEVGSLAFRNCTPPARSLRRGSHFHRPRRATARVVLPVPKGERVGTSREPTARTFCGQRRQGMQKTGARHDSNVSPWAFGGKQSLSASIEIILSRQLGPVVA